MKVQVIVDGETYAVDLDAAGDIVEVEPGVYSILTESRSLEARVSPHGRGWRIEMNGRLCEAEVIDPRNASRQSRAGLGVGRQNVVAPMPGKIVRILVAVGDLLEAGAGLLVVEAMKMQNELKTARAGRVVELRVKAGDTVAAGDVLVVVE